MKRLLLSFATLFLLTACPIRPCGPCETIDFGVINAETLALLPYANGNHYQFKHNAGQLINFTATRNQETVYNGAEECCPNAVKTQEDNILLNPDYNLFDIRFFTQKLRNENDEDLYLISGSIEHTGNFHIPNATDPTNYEYEMLSNYTIGTNNYTDVYKIPVYKRETAPTIYVDTVYYNYTKGIIKICMSNDEYYHINE